MMEYTDHPGSVFEEHRVFDITAEGTGDYYITVGDDKNLITFRYCISGGFEFSHPKTTEAIANLFRVMKEEGGK